MRTIRFAVGLTAAVCALAVAAVPAMAHEFSSSRTGKLSGKGFEEIAPVAAGEFREFNPEKMQEWHFGEFTILCYSGSDKGEMTETSTEVLTLNLKFGSCGWYPKPKVDLHSGASFSKEGITVNFHANGYVETLPDGEEVEFKATIEPSSAYIKVSGKICTINIPAQNIPVASIKKPEEEYSEVLYSNISRPLAKASKEFPTAEQEEVLLSNVWKGIKFVYAGEEAQCTNPEHFEKQVEGGTGGSYKGQMFVRLASGNIKFE